ncbi:uncharacterized protein FIBRA_08888 [Fibroporia radiculosa]|uniref:Major facilitator superfamily (MFS) profile domain-containing protein n=1 Tax=Fibroporia radiculosa TaxID=599839 RepID=J4H5E7_9APHY|nr:uncharacterized protein FIBRA_08888 [Fibroporia radiculosa]CCM06609.1 predicted protein [Fibroporia radiculosa]
MSTSRPVSTVIPPRRTFGPDESAASDAGQSSGQPGGSPLPRRVSGRVSFSTLNHRPSLFGRRRSGVDEETGAAAAAPERPAIPSALQPGESYATPLPKLSMTVLSITMLGEFLSANVSAPFILFMVQGFGQFSDEARVGYWTGILVSTFFLTQFLTSLLWATVAAKHGQRLVLFISLLGSAVTCCLFGTSKSLQQAIAIRLMQGIFAGAIGVARGSVTMITDQSNEGRAYAILGFCWGFGGVAGAIVGGTFESPAKKWPSVFGDLELFINYPYLLPCAVASSITFVGSILCLFVGPDCGPREGTIRLPIEKFGTISEEDAVPTTPLFDEQESRHSFYDTVKQRLSGRLSGYFVRSGQPVQEGTSATSPVQDESLPLSSTPSRTSITKPRPISQTSRANGSAYGYSGTFRNRLSSGYSARPRSNAALSIRRRSTIDGFSSSVGTATGSDLNFAQRLLMANENAVTNIADLWVAAAMNVDNEDPFELESDFDDDAEAFGEEDFAAEEGEIEEEDIFGPTTADPSSRHNRFSRRESLTSTIGPKLKRSSFSGSRHPPPLGSPRRVSSSGRLSFLRPRSSQYSPALVGDELPSMHRRLSTTVPSIFSHVGVRTPPAVLEAQQLLQNFDEQAPGDSLAPILESRRGGTENEAAVEPEELEREPSLMSQLPILIIIQYGLLALHSTTHDQVFYLYLVSKYPLGGLNLNAGHFSQLSKDEFVDFVPGLALILHINSICIRACYLCLITALGVDLSSSAFSNIGPPRGRFSHLAMLRLGSLLFIPSYLSVIMYRVLASANTDGNPILMAALALSTAVRFCGSTFCYTSISVLLNYMSPPHVVGFANGVAQSIVSLARFAGPILGGTLWSMSVQDGPEGYPLGFLACAGACALAIAHSFFIR